MLFTFHRGGLVESKNTTTEVQTMDALREHIQNKWGCVIVGELEFSYAMYDARIQWDTWNVIGCVGNNTRKVVFGQANKGKF